MANCFVPERSKAVTQNVCFSVNCLWYHIWNWSSYKPVLPFPIYFAAWERLRFLGLAISHMYMPPFYKYCRKSKKCLLTSFHYIVFLLIIKITFKISVRDALLYKLFVIGISVSPEKRPVCLFQGLIIFMVLLVRYMHVNITNT